MKREIKFRAWDGKQMHYKVNMLSNWGAIKEGYSGTCWSKEAKAGEPMQYTGLKDRNGKDIYEGDILQYEKQQWHEKNYLGIVKWHDEDAGFYIYLSENEGSLIFDKLEVIGNIYENPELLK